MDRFSFWQKGLFVIGIVVSVLGVWIALFNGTALFDLVFNRQIDPVFWGAGGPCRDARSFQQWIYGVLGATVASWGIALAFVAHYPFKKKEKWAWNSVLIGLLLWYVIDTPVSAYYKVYFNVLFNTVVFVVALLPLVFTKRHFRS